MQLIFLQHSGKPVPNTAGNYWTMAGAAVPASEWRTLQVRVNGLQKSFQRKNYRPGAMRLNANDLLHPKNAERDWTLAFCKGLERIVASLQIKFFLVVVDKRTTDKPAHPKWLLPLSYQYLMKPIVQYLKERNDHGCLVIPQGREEEHLVLRELQLSHLFSSSSKASPLIATPMLQSEYDSCGLQVADFVATVTRRYQEDIYPKLFAKQVLEGYDAVLNSHYQGFVKPNTYQSLASDVRGFRIKGYIYLWRRDPLAGSPGQLGEATVGYGGPPAPAGGFDATPGQPPARRYGPTNRLVGGQPQPAMATAEFQERIVPSGPVSADDIPEYNASELEGNGQPGSGNVVSEEAPQFPSSPAAAPSIEPQRPAAPGLPMLPTRPRGGFPPPPKLG